MGIHNSSLINKFLFTVTGLFILAVVYLLMFAACAGGCPRVGVQEMWRGVWPLIALGVIVIMLGWVKGLKQKFLWCVFGGLLLYIGISWYISSYGLR